MHLIQTMDKFKISGYITYPFSAKIQFSVLHNYANSLTPHKQILLIVPK